MEKSKGAKKTKRVEKKANRVGGDSANPIGFNAERFAQDIITHRHSRGESQRDVCRRVGISPACLVFTENVKSTPSVEVFGRLVKHYKLNPADYV